MNQRTEQSRPKHSAMILGAFCDEFGGVLYKNHELPGESVPAAGGKFWGFGGVVQKNHVAGMHSGTCFRCKTPLKILKNFRLRRVKPPAAPSGRAPSGQNHPPRGTLRTSALSGGLTLRTRILCTLCAAKLKEPPVHTIWLVLLCDENI